MSNLGDLLNDIGVKDSAVVSAIGDTIGVIADASGVVGAVLGVVDFLVSLGDQSNDQLHDVLTVIQNDFQQLNAAIKAENIILRLTNLTNQLAPAQTALDTLNVVLSQQPPADPAERLTQIQYCLTALNALAPENIWTAVYIDQIYWTDAGQYMLSLPTDPGLPPGEEYYITRDVGYGQQAPTGDGSDLVFSYTYILPAYLQALSLFLTVGIALDQNFFDEYTGYAPEVRTAADTLSGRHDTIVGGITQLLPPYWDGQWLSTWLYDVNSIGATVDWLAPGFTQIPEVWNGINIEYGAVDIFSGYSAMANYKLILEEDLPSTSSDPAPYAKFQLRVAHKTKQVYIGVGLRTVWQAINDLKGMIGDAPLPRPTFADWSFRDIIKTTQVSAVNGSVSLITVAKFLKYTPPFDTPSGTLQTSFRDLLEVA